MEWVEGASLRGFIGDGSVPVAQRIEWLVEIARALAAAHELGLVHRDIKPDNVMITKDGHAKVLDFGIAKAIGATDDAPASQKDAPESFRTQQGRIVGTPKYMAPEQLRGDAIDARVDQWAWACVAYELLTGSMPDRDEVPQPISLTTPEVPFDVAAAIVRARSFDPEKRFDSMRALLAAIAVQPSGEVTVSVAPAKRDPDAPTTTGPVRRSGARVALVAVASFALAGLAVLAWARTHPRKNADAASVAPPPACTLAFLPATPPLGELGRSYFSSPQAHAGGVTLAFLRTTEEGLSEQLVTMTSESVTSRAPPHVGPPDSTPAAVFVVATPNELRHFVVAKQSEGLLAVGRAVSSDALVSMSRILPLEDFTPTNVVGVLSPHTKPPSVAFLVIGEEPKDGVAYRSSLRFYGDGVTAMPLFTGKPGDALRSARATSGEHAVAYTFLSGGVLYAGAFELATHVEERRDLFRVTTPMTVLEPVGSRPAAPLGEASSVPGLAMDGDDAHVVWSDASHSRLHHVVFRARADAGAPEESFDAPTNGSAVDLRIAHGTYFVTWGDGAHVWVGAGPSVERAIRRATKTPESALAAGPWLSPTQSGALVAWISGTSSDVHRANVSCR